MALYPYRYLGLFLWGVSWVVLPGCGQKQEGPNLPPCKTISDCKPPEECIAGYCVNNSCLPGDKQFCYSGPDPTANVGTCAIGHKTCDNGQWSICKGEILPQKEICKDGKDNDCNGKIDDGC